MTKLGTSQNGWTVYDDTSHFTRVTVAGVGFWAANADVATVLADFTQRYNDTIESITLPVKEAPGYDDWSYAVRPVRGQTTGYSNHASATAWDLNSTRHPRGVHGTYPGDLRDKLKALVARYHGVLRDGEFYTTSTIDGMHIEINAGAAAVKAEADRIRNEHKEDDMELTDTVKLTAGQAKAMNLNVTDPADRFKEGQEVKVSRLLVWGGPGIERLYAELRAAKVRDAATTAQLKALTTAVQAIAANSPDAIRAATAEFVATVKAELADIDVHVTLGDEENTKETP